MNEFGFTRFKSSKCRIELLSVLEHIDGRGLFWTSGNLDARNLQTKDWVDEEVIQNLSWSKFRSLANSIIVDEGNFVGSLEPGGSVLVPEGAEQFDVFKLNQKQNEMVVCLLDQWSWVVFSRDTNRVKDLAQVVEIEEI